MKIYCSFPCDGLPGAQRGTPLRLLSIATELSTRGWILEFRSPQSHIHESFLHHSMEQAQFVLFLLNSYDVWTHRKLLRTRPDIYVIVDLHSLRSAEISWQRPKWILKELLIELWFRWGLNFLYKPNRIQIVSCNKRLRDRLVTFHNRTKVVVSPGAITFDPINSVRSTDSRQIIYTGNLREYQGFQNLYDACEILSAQGESFNLLVVTNDSFNFPSRTWLDVRVDITQFEAISLCAKSRVAVVPRIKHRINKFSFPSKVLDYLSSGVTVLITPWVPELPQELEKLVVRSADGTSREIARSLCHLLNKDYVLSESIEQQNAILSSYSFRKLCTDLETGVIDFGNRISGPRNTN